MIDRESPYRYCLNCTSKSELQAHRVKPGCHGGTYDAANVVWLCNECHTKLHRHMNVLRGRPYPTSQHAYMCFTISPLALEYQLDFLRGFRAIGSLGRTHP